MTRFGVMAFFGGLVLLALSAASVHGQATKAPAKGIDAETVAAYEKLGAVYGGWRNNVPMTWFLGGREKAEQGLPGFRFDALPNSKLPAIAVPFGLHLKNANLPDAGLRIRAKITWTKVVLMILLG
jgi:hypothetical protein